MNASRFGIAEPAEDAQLRALLAATPMDGHVRVSFRRDPDYFQASVVEGPFRQTLVARDGEQVIAAGCRSVRSRYINGLPTPIGYLSGLRLRAPYRGSGLLGRGYRFLHTLHQDRRTKLYITTIAEGNEVALNTLTSARTWLPGYHSAGKYFTLVIPLLRPRRRAHTQSKAHTRSRALAVRSATESDLPTVLNFLHATGPRHQFFPDYQANDFFREEGTFRGLRAVDIALAFEGRQLVGMLGGWDQRSFRQTVVEGYSGPLRLLRHAYNLSARLRHRPQLPAPHQVFPFITAALPVVAQGKHHVVGDLLDHLAQTLTHSEPGGDTPCLLLGLHENDELEAAARPFATHDYVTRLFHVCWGDGEPLRLSLDQRPPYLELGCL